MKYILGSLILAFSLSSCNLYKTLRYGGIPGQKDYKHFSQREVSNGEKEPFCFKPPMKEYGLGESIGVTDQDFNSTNVSLDAFMDLHNTIAFMIIRNDTLLYEQYRQDYNESTAVSSFSMVKPIISTLIGIAIDEGKIDSEDDSIIKYLPEYTSKVGWDKISVENLLHHTSGIEFTDSKFSPLSDNAEYYWGDDLRQRVLDAHLECPPNTIFKYSSVNTMLLGLIVEKVYQQTISETLESKLWSKLGMEAPAYWSLDRSDSLGVEKAFCCLQARASDFAKFGRLYLNEGNWEGDQIVSKKWVNYSTNPDPEGNNKHNYNNNWGIGPAKYKSFFAVGLFGQYLYIYPEKNIMIVRFGDTETSAHPNYWQSTFLQIIDQMEAY
jgi:CubicO group peptidase (beta-lactamase class C family)